MKRKGERRGKEQKEGWNIRGKIGEGSEIEEKRSLELHEEGKHLRRKENTKLEKEKRNRGRKGEE